MNIAIILVVVVVTGVVGYFLVMRSKTDAPLPMDQRKPVAVVTAPGDTPSVINDAAAKAVQSAALKSIARAGSAARLSLVTS